MIKWCLQHEQENEMILNVKSYTSCAIHIGENFTYITYMYKDWGILFLSKHFFKLYDQQFKGGGINVLFRYSYYCCFYIVSRLLQIAQLLVCSWTS